VVHCINVPLSVISAKVKLALRCRSTLSENTRVLKARNGSPEKKSVSPRCISSANAYQALGSIPYILEELKEVCNGFSFALGQNGFV
jgi:hypothetical protein